MAMMKARVAELEYRIKESRFAKLIMGSSGVLLLIGARKAAGSVVVVIGASRPSCLL